MQNFIVSEMHNRIASIIRNRTVMLEEDVLSGFDAFERDSARRALKSMLVDHDIEVDDSGHWVVSGLIRPKPVDEDDFRNRLIRAAMSDHHTRTTISKGFSSMERPIVIQIMDEMFGRGDLIRIQGRIMPRDGLRPQDLLEEAVVAEEIEEEEPAAEAVALELEASSDPVEVNIDEAVLSEEDQIDLTKFALLAVASVNVITIASAFALLPSQNPSLVADAIKALEAKGDVILREQYMMITGDGLRRLEGLGEPPAFIADLVRRLQDKKAEARSVDVREVAERIGPELVLASSRILSPYDLEVLSEIAGKKGTLMELQDRLIEHNPDLISQTVMDLVVQRLVTHAHGGLKLTADGQARLSDRPIAPRLDPERDRLRPDVVAEYKRLEKEQERANAKARRHAEAAERKAVADEERRAAAVAEREAAAERRREEARRVEDPALRAERREAIKARIKDLLNAAPVIDRSAIAVALQEHDEYDVYDVVRELVADGEYRAYGHRTIGRDISLTDGAAFQGGEAPIVNHCGRILLTLLARTGPLQIGDAIDACFSWRGLDLLAAMHDLIARGDIELILDRVIRLHGQAAAIDAAGLFRVESSTVVEILKRDAMSLSELVCASEEPEEVVIDELMEAVLLNVVRPSKGETQIFVHEDHFGEYDFEVGSPPRPHNLLGRLETGRAYEVEALKRQIGWLVDFDADLSALRLAGQVDVITVLACKRLVIRRDATDVKPDNVSAKEARPTPASLAGLLGADNAQALQVLQRHEPAAHTTFRNALPAPTADELIGKMVANDLVSREIPPGNVLERYILSPEARRCMELLVKHGDPLERLQTPRSLEARYIQDAVEKITEHPFFALLLQRPMRGIEIQQELELTRARVQQLTTKAERYGLIRQLRTATEVAATFVAYPHFDRYDQIDFKAGHQAKQLLAFMRPGGLYARTELMRAAGRGNNQESAEAFEWLETQGLIATRQDLPGTPVECLKLIRSAEEEQGADAYRYGLTDAFGLRMGQIVRIMLDHGPMELGELTKAIIKLDRYWTVNRVEAIVRRMVTAGFVETSHRKATRTRKRRFTYGLTKEQQEIAMVLRGLEGDEEAVVSAPEPMRRTTIDLAAAEATAEKILKGVLPGKAYLQTKLWSLLETSERTGPAVDLIVDSERATRIEFEPERFIILFSPKLKTKKRGKKAAVLRLEHLIGGVGAEIMDYLLMNGPTLTSKIKKDAEGWGRSTDVSNQAVLMLKKRGLIEREGAGGTPGKTNSLSERGRWLISLVENYGELYD